MTTRIAYTIKTITAIVNGKTKKISKKSADYNYFAGIFHAGRGTMSTIDGNEFCTLTEDDHNLPITVYVTVSTI
jgi:hypothetical protein